MSDLGFNIGAVRLDNPLIMAPLAGVTNRAFRSVVKDHGPALTVTEMISAAGLCLGGAKTMKMTERAGNERPFSVQLFGIRPEWLARAAAVAQEAGADIVDLNLGCPARKVARHGAGAALLKDFPLVEKILSAMRRAITCPLTVKTRAGWRPGEGEVLDLVPILTHCGVDAVTLHPRYGVQRFSGQADWDLVARLVERFPGPVIGNGDVTRPAHVLTRLKSTGCAGVMIGRAALGRPWLFTQTLDLLRGRTPAEPALAERWAVARHHALNLADQEGPLRATYMLRSILMWYTKGLPESTTFRQAINQEKDFNRLLELLDAYFSRLELRENQVAAA